MGINVTGKFGGTLVTQVKSQLFKLIEGVLSVAVPNNTQSDGVESRDFALMSLQSSACCRCAASDSHPGLMSSRRNSSRPDAILVTPHPTNPNRPPTPSSHRLLRSTGSDTTPAHPLDRN
eukprot:1146310-Pelagomonas_calceolata.AAC.6